MHEISLVHHVRLSVPAVVSQQGNVLGSHRAHLHGAGDRLDAVQVVKVGVELDRRQSLVAAVTRVSLPLCHLHRVVRPNIDKQRVTIQKQIAWNVSKPKKTKPSFNPQPLRVLILDVPLRLKSAPK